jgi:hypothetical protein
MLAPALEQVRDRIARYRGRSSSIGEQNTKAALIEPILRALGWDVEDPEEVWREYRRRSVDNPVDYALMILRTPRLFVEAKSLGENLDDPKWANQIMSYAVVAGVEWVVLTNGDEYHIYNSHAAVPVEDKLFRTIRLTDDSTDVAGALDILSKHRTEDDWIGTLWKAHFVDRQMRSALAALFTPEPDQSLVRLLSRKLPTLTAAEIRAGLRRIDVRLDMPGPPSFTGVQPSESRPVERKPEKAKPARRSAGQVGADAEAASWQSVTVQDLIAAGLIRPPLELVKTYKGRRLTGRVEADGRVTCLGQTFDSLSTSAGVARASIIGTPPGRRYPQTNGWVFWRFRDSDGLIKRLDVLRQRFHRPTP